MPLAALHLKNVTLKPRYIVLLQKAVHYVKRPFRVHPGGYKPVYCIHGVPPKK